ncbi:3'(2'),5'-bisphosphate nucleotidase CysQ [Aestuariivirga sp.]|uniref:3'(2'),5'-bisphosphate nucleotidase CysQ n=1 Tax=Aestuariivirga sp. TaxID=2650926 RepID=UPI0025BD7610|nr:3'(2'),5'-bisphosphate nucleotidase CysQ [Aestuariivirga sp.]
MSDAELLADVVREAGELGLSLGRNKNLKHWTKPDGSHVTEGDLAINALFERRLRAARPGDGWLSEETPDDPRARMARDRLWIIDPIDGTRAFLEGRAEWCVAAALAVNGRPVLAAVYTPRHDEFFVAALGEGTTLNGARLSMRDQAALEGARIAGNRKALAGLAHLGISADPSGALPLQLRLAHVAAGRVAAAVSIGNRNDWDLAAGELLVAEAGGRVSGTSGEGYIYNRAQPWQQGLVAAGAKRHAALIDALNSQRTP